MTTNVYDIAAGIFASDSRWSKLIENWIIYIDDTNYDKIVSDEALAILFAGDMLQIEQWKKWFMAGRVGSPPLMHLDGISICMSDMTTGNVVFDSGDSIKSPHYRFAGTGAPHARNCWDINKDAKKSVATATTMDICSGGSVVYLERFSLRTNVMNVESYDGVYRQLKERGMMKNLNTDQPPVPIKEAVSDVLDDPAAKQIANQIMAGQVSLCAPFPGMHEQWSEEKKKELVDVLARYTPIK